MSVNFEKPQVALVIMTGSQMDGEAATLVARAHEMLTLDTLEKTLEADVFAPIIVATKSRDLARELARYSGIEVEIDKDDEPFHFGNKLRELIIKYRLEKLLYVSGGSGVLLSPAELRAIATQLYHADRVVILNNFYSTDFAAFTPASMLNYVELPATDNPLGWLLGEDLGVPVVELPRTASTQFDVDTPTDLMTLSVSPHVGRHTRTYLDNLDLDTRALVHALSFITNRSATIIVAGRVSATTWTYMEKETACQTRVYSEERGMRASGRKARGEVCSLLGYYLDEVGNTRFFEKLATMGDAVFLDSRVLFAHMRQDPSANDRFLSDLRQPAAITAPFVQEFTAAAMAAPVPVILGGHSLVAGGMYALIESAWMRGDDLARSFQTHIGE